MRTFDGLAYELQQVGEYVYSSDGGDFVVQARTAPFRGSSTVAGNQAVAAYVAGDRVAYYYGTNEPLRINGAPAVVPAGGLALANGGYVVRLVHGYRIEWPSGELLTLRIHAVIDIAITIPDRTKHYVGLLGTWDGSPRNDLVPRGGEPLPWPISMEQVYGEFGDSWRVTPEESLFDYGPGQDTSTFTDEAFPSHVLTARTLPTALFNQAHDACVAAGVSDQVQLEDCILDVAAAGDEQLALALVAGMADLPPAVEQITFNGYYQTFEGPDDGLWSTGARYAMPAMDMLAPTSTLGLISGGQSVVLAIPALPAHSDVSVAFDIHVIGPWAGNAFEAAADGVPFTQTSFSNTAAPQAFPGQLLDPEQSAQSGALATGALDDQSKAIYHHSYTFAHSAGSLSVSFVAPSLPAGASFALDNVAVVTGAVGDPWDPKCAPGGPSLDDGNPCTIDLCDPSQGAVHLPRAAGTTCSDGDLCNGEETCNGIGHCVRTPLPLDDGNPCTADVCDPVLGVVHLPLESGTSCSDGYHCNGVETCDGLGLCQQGEPPDPATLPADTTCNLVDEDCDGIVDDDYVPAETSCGVGACANTGATVCASGAVQNLCTPLPAAPSDGVCDGIDEDCDGVVDESFAPQCASGGISVCTDGMVDIQSCDDGDLCTVDECSGGICVHSPLSCDDGNSCTNDSCDPLLGCRSEVLTSAACDDGDLCTSGESCTAEGLCIGGTPIDPDDGSPCTDDFCDPNTGVYHIPAPGRSCDDGDVCNGVEVCDPDGGCLAGTSPAIDDQNPCTVDSCDPVLGVRHELSPVSTACGDGRYCDGLGGCLTFGQCAENLVVNAGQTLTFTGPCEINSIAFNGGTLIVNGALRTPTVTMQSGGSLQVNGSSLHTERIQLSNGSIRVDGPVEAEIAQSGGSIQIGGRYDVEDVAHFAMTAGTFTNLGPMTMPVFDASMVSGGTFINRGRLNVLSDSLVVASGVTLSESGQVGEDDSIGSLEVHGVLRHELRHGDGLSLRVRGDALVASSGAVSATGMGLRGAGQSGNTTNSGEMYGPSGEVVLAAGGTVGASHGGLGGNAPANRLYGSVTSPVLLGAGGSCASGSAGGNGGGRIDLEVEGTLTLQGVMRADGTGGGTGAGGGGAGGSIWLRVGTFAGNGPISANAGAANAGGGGGRIAVQYASRSHNGLITARGAGNTTHGGPGTVYLKLQGAETGELVVDNGTLSGAAMAVMADGTLGTVTVQSGTVSLQGEASGQGILPRLVQMGGTINVQDALILHGGLLSGGTLNVPTSLQFIADAAFGIVSGTLNASGVLTLSDSATLTMTGGVLNATGTTHVNDSATLAIAGGVLNVTGTAHIGDSAMLTLSGGTINHTGEMTLGRFDTNVTGGTFNNRGKLTVVSDVMSIKPGVVFNQSGIINGDNSLAHLTVEGTLTHDLRLLQGLRLGISGDATIVSGGRIDLNGRGLRGGRQPGSTTASGEEYVWDGASYVIATGSTINAGGSHGGQGAAGSAAAAAPYGYELAPVLLGGGGDASAATGGNAGGNGGGALDLMVQGTLTVNGEIRANGALGASTANGGAGAGGPIRLRARTFAGTGTITANGGAPTSGQNQASGGGGRVSVEYYEKTFSGVLQANGGTANSKPGQHGTVYQRDLISTPGDVAPAIGAGAFSVCHLESTGEIACFGNDEHGIVSRAPIGVYSKIAMGPYAACSIHESGLVHCWGETAPYGVHNAFPDRMTDVAVALTVACGVRQSDSSIQCWGLDSNGLISGRPAGQFERVYMAGTTACAQHSDGTVACWGSDATQAVTQAPTTALTAVSGGAGFFCAVLPDGSLSCWGANDYGQSMPPFGSGHVDVASGSRHACALDDLGAAVCWGDDSAGQSMPTTGEYMDLVAGDDFTCGMSTFGVLSCWGLAP